MKKSLLIIFSALMLSACVNPLSEIPLLSLSSAVQLAAADSALHLSAVIVRIDEDGIPSILNVSGHESLGFSSVENKNGVLRVNYQNTAAKIHYFATEGDECLSRYNATGASGKKNSIDVQFRTTVFRQIELRAKFNGSSWDVTPFPRCEDYKLSTNAAQTELVFNHERAEFFAEITRCSDVNAFVNDQIKAFNTKVTVKSPKMGDCFYLKRELDKMNPSSLFVPLQKVVGGVHCNVNILFLHSD